MKTRLITTSVLLAAMFIGTSCSKDTDTGSGAPQEEGTKTVTIKFGQTAGRASRGSNPTQPAGETAGIYDYFIMFLDNKTAGEEVVLRTVRFTNASGVLTTGTYSVPSKTEKVYMIANLRAARDISGSAATGTEYPADNAIIGKTIKEAKALMAFQAKSQCFTGTLPTGKTTSASRVVMQSETVTIEDGVAAMVLKPIVARMEIGNITVTGDGAVAGIRIAGIFIGNFYESYNMSTGVTDMFAIAKNGTNQAPYIATYPRGTALTGTPGRPTTYNADFNTANGVSLSPPANRVWAYQVFPAVGADNLPKIVIKIENITVSGETSNILYAIVKGYTRGTAPAAVTKVENFLSGYVYKVGNISIPTTKLTPDPSDPTKDITVNVSVEDWTIDNISPEL